MSVPKTRDYFLRVTLAPAEADSLRGQEATLGELIRARCGWQLRGVTGPDPSPDERGRVIVAIALSPQERTALERDARLAGLTRSNLVRQRLGLPLRQDGPGAPKGNKNHAGHPGVTTPRPKLTLRQVRSIRRRAEQGETQQSIADRFSVARSTVAAIVRRETWRDAVIDKPGSEEL